MDFQIRVIEPRDNPAMAQVIQRVMPEFDAGGEGFSIHDPEVTTMSAAYYAPRHVYFIVERIDGAVLGGAGVAPLTGGDPSVCELRKMYILPEGRGHGLGEALMQRCLEAARERGFTYCYLETLRTMTGAHKLYARHGFEPLSGPLGNTGHHGCDQWMGRRLEVLTTPERRI
jgi:putative acetyltransferase